MANEAVCIETPTKFARYTVADGTGIAIGTLLKLTDPNTAIATSASSDAFAGIAWEEKTANDGITEIVAALDGVWDILTSAGSEPAGSIMKIGGANITVIANAATLLTGAVVGKVLESTGNAEVGRHRVGAVV